MTAPSCAVADTRRCPDCRCSCTGEQRKLAEQVRERHEAAVHRALYGPPKLNRRPLPEPPAHTRWVADRWDHAHLIGCDGKSLCGHVMTSLGSRPARNGADWCEKCAHIRAGECE